MLALLVPLALAGCTQGGTGNAGSTQVTLTTTPAQPAVGPAQVTVTLKDASGNPIDNAQVAVEGDMTHAGMVPVQANAVGEGSGQYVIKDFSFTMGGDWVLTVSATLPDGTKAQQVFNINGVSGSMPMTPGASTTGTMAPSMPMTGTVAPDADDRHDDAGDERHDARDGGHADTLTPGHGAPTQKRQAIMNQAATRVTRRSAPFDVLRLPVVGPFLRWRHARAVMQIPLLLAAALMLYDGFTGPSLAPKNLAGVAPWVHWRGFVVLALLVAGNLFCMACPFMLPRKLAKKLFPANRTWPRALRSKWLAAGLLLVFFWAYEGLNLWASPWLTAWVALAYFGVAFVVDGFFKGAAFCKYVCPIGQFNFVNSLVSPLEVRVRDTTTCATCTTHDCIKGHFGPAPGPRPARAARPAIPLQSVAAPTAGMAVAAAAPAPAAAAAEHGPLLQTGCELWLFQDRKHGNMDCTFCLDCVHACPHDNVGIMARVPASELWDDQRRSGVGVFSKRTDLAALILVLVFASFMNAFGMVSPVYPIEQAIAVWLGTTSKAIVVLAILGPGLILLPLLSVGLAAWVSRALSGARESVVAVATRYTFALVPMGFGMWLAHYSFHFLTGALTIFPVVANFFGNNGLPIFGAPFWGVGTLVPSSWLVPIELMFLEAGLITALVVAYRIARREHPVADKAMRAFVPWAFLLICLCAFGVWLMLQPMEMRGTLFAGS